MKDKQWFDEESDLEAMARTTRTGGMDPEKTKVGRDLHRASRRNARTLMTYSINPKVTLPKLKFLEGSDD